MALRIFLFLLAVIWTPYGMYCLAFPGALEQIAGIVAPAGTASVELRAMYGGVQTAVGLTALLAFFNAGFARQALFTQVAVFAGLAGARTLGVLIEGHFSGYTIGALAFEWPGLLLCLWFYRRAADAQW